MRSITTYLKTIQRLQEQAPIDLDVRRSGDELHIANTRFKMINPAHLHKEVLEGQGVLVPDLTVEEARYCEVHRISYLTTKGKLRLFTKKLVLTIDPRKPESRRRPSQKNATPAATPTVLLSPNGFKILDAIFRLPKESVGRYKSALSFADQFSLNQPRLSMMMRVFNVSTVEDLRKAIAELSEDWWKMALASKSVRRGLTPFFLSARPHYSLLDTPNHEVISQLTDLFEKRDELVPGPTDVAKGLGFLRDEDISVWGTEEALHRLKTKFKLIPGVHKERPIWQLASPRYELEAEGISTHGQSDVSDTRSVILSHANHFRALWDLGFGTERLKELQIPMLRGLLNGI